MTKKLIFIAILLAAVAARADTGSPEPIETWTVEGKVYASKGEAIRSIVASGKTVSVVHSHCQVLTNALTFKNCPKNKAGSFDKEQFRGLKVSATQ